jgi:hypothetical protein
MKTLGAVLSLWLAYALMGAEAPLRLNKLNPTNFVRHFPTYSMLNGKSITLPKEQKRSSSPQGTKELVIHQLTDQKTPYEDSRAEIIVMSASKPKWHLRIEGFKNLNADWVTEEVIKIEIWPGRAVQLVELINIETGTVLFRSATGFVSAPSLDEK